MEQSKKEFNALNKQIAELKKVSGERYGSGTGAKQRAAAAAAAAAATAFPRLCSTQEGFPGRVSASPSSGRSRVHVISAGIAPPPPQQQPRPATVSARARAAADPLPRPNQPLHPPPQAKQDAAELMESSKRIKGEIADLEQREKDMIAARDAALAPIGNLVHDSVPVSDDEVRF